MNPAYDGQNRLRLGEVVFDQSACQLIDRHGSPIAVREQSLRVLKELAARNGETVDKDDLVSAVWAGISVSDDSLVQCIKDIRTALGDSKRQLLRTAVGRGYSLHGVWEIPISPGSLPKLLISTIRVRVDALHLVELAENITEELIIALSTRSGLRVTTDEAQRETALYAINGRASQLGEKIRVFVQLVKGQSGDVVFAKTWHVPVDKADALPNQITEQISNILRVHMITYAGEEYIARDNDELNTQELLAKAAYHMARFQIHNWDAARTALSLAVERDQTNAMALAMRASMATQMIPNAAFSKIPDDHDYCFDLADRAVGIAPRIDFVIRTRGNLRLWLKADHEGARADCERALSVNPSFHLANLTIATSEIFACEHETGAQRMKKLMEVCTANDQQFPLYLSLLALSQLLEGDIDAALQSAREGHERAPSDAWCSYVYAAAAADREKITKTEGFRRMVAGIDLPYSHFRDLPFTDMREVDMLEERLTIIGFPRSS